MCKNLEKERERGKRKKSIVSMSETGKLKFYLNSIDAKNDNYKCKELLFSKRIIDV